MAPSAGEWSVLFKSAQKQALIGLLATGLERLSDNQLPPKSLLLQWIGLITQIETRNKQLTDVCAHLSEQLSQDGFSVCILKGQANHVYYPDSIANRRTCGDIDVWVVPSNYDNNPVKSVMGYLENHYDVTGLCWLHASMNDTCGVPVEVHFRPSFMNEPLHNRRFQRYFHSIEKFSCLKPIDGKLLPAMRVDEDVIYQMNHIYRHLIDEGVGLRQVVDYYYLLRAWNEKHKRSKLETMKIVSWLGMQRFAGALMYVLREVCGMQEETFLCPASESDGHFLLNEILLAGNFGQSDPRLKTVSGESGNLKFQICRAWRRVKRNMRFVSSYPGEVIWEPLARMWHFTWKKLKLWRVF